MVQTRAISENITLKYLRDNFGLQRTTTPDFFPEWQESLPSLSPQDETALNRITTRYFYQLEEGIMLEEGVKMMIVSPLLDLAGFYDPPYRTRFEPMVTVAVETEEETLQGRIDALVVQDQFWVWVVEAKRTTFSLSLGIPQALAYMLSHPYSNRPTYGFLTGGDNFLFLKLEQQNSPVYGFSRQFSILNPRELGEVLKILRKMGVIVESAF